MPDLPSGTVTLLFTDIEGSTKLWQQSPTAMEPVLARHNALLRKAIEHNDGYVFKTTGDGFCAAFSTASSAITAAVTAQRALAHESWSESARISVRMALHTGAAEVHDNDYSGQPRNRVARLIADTRCLVAARRKLRWRATPSKALKSRRSTSAIVRSSEQSIYDYPSHRDPRLVLIYRNQRTGPRVDNVRRWE